jgi:hypothetical protein
MAKKKTTRRGDFNLSAEVRQVLSENPESTGKEALAALKKKFPKQAINENSFGVAYSTGRKKLGISKSRKVRRRKPAAARRSRASSAPVDIQTLQAARRFLAEIGDADVAINAIKQLQSLQIR